jgi:hypothetical protein
MALTQRDSPQENSAPPRVSSTFNHVCFPEKSAEKQAFLDACSGLATSRRVEPPCRRMIP